MTDADELRSLVELFNAPKRKKGLFSRKNAGASARLTSAKRLAHFAATGNPEAAALDALDAAVKEFPDESEVRLAFAGSLAAAGRHGDAIAEFEEHLRAHPEDSAALSAVARLYEQTGREDSAVERLHRAVDAYVKSGDLDAAVGAARRLISLEPTSLARASELVSMLKEREPALLVDALEHLANVYRDREKLGQEADACSDLIALAPERHDVRSRLAAIYARIVEVDPEDDDAWTGLANADPDLSQRLRDRLRPADRARGGEPQEAATSASPELHVAYAARKARELMDAGDVAGASLCLERALKGVSDPGTQLVLAQCYQALHRGPEAVRAALRSVASACADGDDLAADAALGWLASIRPGAEGPLSDAVFLNHRPESADTLYEELLQSWDEVENIQGAAAAGRSD
jgi:tetratricopeptide (TPR) repeat protein